MDWTRGRIIGQGSSATVSIARHCSSGRLTAVKSVDLSNSGCLEREALILSKVNCPNIIAYEGCGVTNENGVLMFNLYMEFASRGTISDAIRVSGGRIDEAVIRSYTSQILDGLAYLQSNGVVHCDIKASNVLITDDGVVKIGDLGCAKTSVDDDQAPVSGTPLFMAPEVARGEHQGYPADIWALGCTVIEMATGKPPWITGFSDPLSTLYRIGYSGEVPEVPYFMSKQAKDFLSRCFAIDPNKRWSASELLDHDFLQKSGVKNPSDDIPGSNSFTPTSVLEQKLWELQEDQTPTTPNLTQMDCPETSPAVRIHQLSKDMTTSCSSTVPGRLNWALNESWVTVRGVGISSQDHKSLTRISIGSSSTTSCKHSCRILDTLLDSKHCNVANDDLCVKHDIENSIGKQSFFLFSFPYRTPLHNDDLCDLTTSINHNVISSYLLLK